MEQIDPRIVEIDACKGEAFRIGQQSGHVSAAWRGRMGHFARLGLPGTSPALIGAFPFDPAGTGYLYETRPGPLPAQGPGRPAGTARLTALPEAEAYGQAVARAVARLGDPATGLHKVVLARTLRCVTEHAHDPMALAETLGQDRHVTRFALPLPHSDGTPEWLVGATPELLLDKRGAAIRSHPLAGSARRSADPREDAAIGQRLLESRKDLAEHRHVVEYIHDVLAPHCAALSVPERPALQRTASMWHLGTDIRGTLRDPDMPCLALLEKLHPTPAVAGTPLAPALKLIADSEPQPRGFYAGTLGSVDRDNNGTWYVTLRCALLHGTEARLHAGAGIVAASTPAAEIAETSAKFIAMRDALGIDTTF